MAKHVFILGAGASHHTGAPLMNNFIDVAEDSIAAQDNPDDYRRITKVLNFIEQLKDVYNKAYIDLNNVEAIFGALEMAQLIVKLKSYSLDEIKSYYSELAFTIARTLERTVKFPFSNHRIRPDNIYNQFCDKLNVLQDYSIITFNYDVALDVTLHLRGSKVNYMLNENNASGVKLLKLHGSINWGKCMVCNEIVPFDLDFYMRFFDGPVMTKTTCLNFIGKFNLLRQLHQHENFNELPTIVPPTWNKSEYHNGLSNVWKSAANELYNAQYIYIIGYSLPESDTFFKYLYALGVLGGARLRGIFIFNPDKSPDTIKRYKGLIGRGVEDRFYYEPLNFEETTVHLLKYFKKN